MSDLVKFLSAVKSHWVTLVTGSFLAAVWTFISSSVQVAVWGIALILVLTVLWACFLSWRDLQRRCNQLAERLRPKLTIVGISHSAPTDDHRRIRVHNGSGTILRFRARLLRTSPPIPYPLPVDLQPTHCSGTDTEAEIGPDQDQPVDVFVQRPLTQANNPGCDPPVIVVDPNRHPHLKLMGNPPVLWHIPRDHRIELLIGVYPLTEEGETDQRWFYIVPQRNGEVIFTADGPG